MIALIQSARDSREPSVEVARHDPLVEALRAHTAGEYVILGQLGRGGMATVYLAHDVALDRVVALKVMHPELLATLGMRRRFIREARLAARLDHPRIVTVHAVVERGGIVFADLRRIEGTPLDDLTRRLREPLPIDVARWLVATIADALYYAHGKGVIHRDVKPANVIVDRRGDPTVTDFGIAIASESVRITEAGTVLGTPAYMSPEQCLGHEVGTASDQYSLGIVAYEMLTGRVPFAGSGHEVQRAHARVTPPAPHIIAPRVPEAISTVVMRMLAKRPADRWPSAVAAADALMGGVTVSEDRIRRHAAALVGRTLDRVLPALRPTSVHRTQGRRAAPTQLLTLREQLTRSLRAFRALERLGPPLLAGVVAMSVARGHSPHADPLERTLIPPATVAEWDRDQPYDLDPALDERDTTVARLFINPPTVRLAVGDSLALSAIALTRTGEPVTRRFSWGSDNPRVVMVDADGWIRAVAPGRPLFVKVASGRDSAFALVVVE